MAKLNPYHWARPDGEWAHKKDGKRFHGSVYKSWAIKMMEMYSVLSVMGREMSMEEAVAEINAHPTEFIPTNADDNCPDRLPNGRCPGHD